MNWNVKAMDELVSTEVSGGPSRAGNSATQQRPEASEQSLVTSRSRSISVKLGHGEGNVKLWKMRLDPEG